jgi:hypothetical protein
MSSPFYGIREALEETKAPKDLDIGVLLAGKTMALQRHKLLFYSWLLNYQIKAAIVLSGWIISLLRYRCFYIYGYRVLELLEQLEPGEQREKLRIKNIKALKWQSH